MTSRALETEPQKQIRKRLQKLVKTAKALESQYGSSTWTYNTDMVGHRGRVHVHFRVKIDGERVTEASPEMPTELADWAKIHVACRKYRSGVGSSSIRREISAFQWLHGVLVSNSICSSIHVTSQHFFDAENMVASDRKGIGSELILQGLAAIAKFANRERLTLTPITYVASALATRGQDVFSQERRQKERELLTSEDTFEALGRVRSRITSSYDRIMFSLLDVVFATGVRAGECLSAPTECLGWQKNTNPETKKQELVRTFRSPIAKSGRRIGKPLSDVQRPIVENAIAIAIKESEEARSEMRWMERNPGLVPFARGRDMDDLIDQHALAEALGISTAGSKGLRRRLKMKAYRAEGQTRWYRVGDVVAKYAEKRHAEEEALKSQIAKGAPKKLSNWLFIEFGSFTGRQVVKPIGYSRLVHWLSNPSYSVFVRHGEAQHRLNAHAMRRILHTAAKEGGIGDLELARYFGRRSVETNAAYDYRTPQVRAAEVRSAIQRGEAFGAVAKAYWRLPESLREEYLDTYVKSALRVIGGFCLHNHALEPCPFFIACLRGCSKFMVIRKDQQNELGLQEQIDNMTGQLDMLNVPWRGHPKPELLGTWASNLIRQIEFAEMALKHVRSEGTASPVIVDPSQVDNSSL